MADPESNETHPVPRVEMGSFAFKRTHDTIQYELQRRSRSGDNVEVYMPSIRLVATVDVSMINKEYSGCEYFCVGTHGYPENPSIQDSGMKNDILKDIFNLTEGNYPIVGYTIDAKQGTVKLIRAKDESARNLSVPPPGIESVTISRNTNGRITRLSGTIAIPSYAQYEELSKYFLIPGVGILLEVANIYTNKSIDKVQKYPPFINLSDGELTRDIVPQTTTVPFAPLENIIKRSIDSNGAYTAFFGRMANFKTTLQGTAYIIDFDCVGAGDASMGISMYEPLTQTANEAVTQTNTTNTLVRDWFVPTSENKLSPFYDSLIEILNATTTGDPALEDYIPHVKLYSYGTLGANLEEAVLTRIPNDLGAVTSLIGGYSNPIFISWAYFVNVVLNDKVRGVRQCYLDHSSSIKLIHKLDDYTFGTVETTYDNKYEPLVGSHKRLRSTNAGVMIIYNEYAQSCVSGDPVYNNLVGGALTTNDKEKFSDEYKNLGDFHWIKDKNAGTLSRGVWLNANNIVEIFKASNTLHQALTTLLSQMNAATGHYWNLALDFDEDVLSDFIVVDLNFSDSTGPLVTAYENSYIFNQPFVVAGNKLVSGSGAISINVDVALKSSLVATAVFASETGTIGHAGSQLSAFSNKGDKKQYRIWEYDITRRGAPSADPPKSSFRMITTDGGKLTYHSYAPTDAILGSIFKNSSIDFSDPAFSGNADKAIAALETRLAKSREAILKNAIINNSEGLRLPTKPLPAGDPIRGIPWKRADTNLLGNPTPQFAGQKLATDSAADIKKYMDDLIERSTVYPQVPGQFQFPGADNTRVSQRIPHTPTDEEKTLIAFYQNIKTEIKPEEAAAMRDGLQQLREAKRQASASPSGVVNSIEKKLSSAETVDSAVLSMDHLKIIFGLMELMPSYMAQKMENSVKYDANNNFGFNGSLPIKVSVTIPGIGGFRSGEIIRIARLPDPYTEAAFLILGTTDSITSDAGWTTTLEAKYLPKTMFDNATRPKLTDPDVGCSAGKPVTPDDILGPLNFRNGPPKQATPKAPISFGDALKAIQPSTPSSCPELREFIGQSESNSNYDALNRGASQDTAMYGKDGKLSPEYAESTNGKRLSDMSIREIFIKMDARGNRGGTDVTLAGTILAAGKYQIIPKNLHTLVDQLTAAGSLPQGLETKFNSVTQDMFYEQIIRVKKSNVGDFLSGQNLSGNSTPAEVATRLADELANEWGALSPPSRRAEAAGHLENCYNSTRYIPFGMKP